MDQLDLNLDVKNLASDNEYHVLESERMVQETKDHFYVPDDRSNVCKITKLYQNPNDAWYDSSAHISLLEFMDRIIGTLPLPFEVSINVGFFVKDKEWSSLIKYVKPGATSSVITANVTNLEHYWNFRRQLNKVDFDIIGEAWKNACDDLKLHNSFTPINNIALLCIYLRKL